MPARETFGEWLSKAIPERADADPDAVRAGKRLGAWWATFITTLLEHYQKEAIAYVEGVLPAMAKAQGAARDALRKASRRPDLPPLAKAAAADCDALRKASRSPDLPPPAFSEDVWAELLGLLEDAYEAGDKMAAGIVGYGSKAARTYAERRAAELLGRRWNGTGWVERAGLFSVPDNVRNEVHDLVVRAVDEGWDVGTLNNELYLKFEATPGRSLTIARTELGTAYNEATAASYEVAGVERVLVYDGPGCLPMGHDDDAEPPEPDVIGIQADREANGQVWTVEEAKSRVLSHPNCFPSGTVVFAPHHAVVAAIERPFEGEVVVLRTAADDLLTCTLDHPILTGRGWVAAGALSEADHVVRCLDPERVAALIDPDDEYVPAVIEEVARTFLKAGRVPSRGMPSAAEQLQSNCIEGEVDIVRSDGTLGMDDVHPGGGEQLREPGVIEAPVGARRVLANGAAAQVSVGMLPPAHGSVGSRSDLLAEAVWTPGKGIAGGVSSGAKREAVSTKGIAEYAAVTAELLGDLVGGLAGEVADIERAKVPGDAQPSRRAALYSECLETSVDRRFADPQALRDALGRFVSLVAFTQITKIERHEFSGHVYNLQMKNGWYIAGGIVTHNCGRVFAPVLPN
jgi:hypothetical protein